MSVEERAKEIAEKTQNASPRKFIERESPLRFITTMPPRPNTHAIIFFALSFSCLKISDAMRIAKKVEEPVRIVPLTPLVFARPT